VELEYQAARIMNSINLMKWENIFEKAKKWRTALQYLEIILVTSY